MINHIRTALLNRRSQDMEGVTGYEYIPPTFFPIKLPKALEQVHRVLYPQGLDKFGQHEVTSRLVQLLHQPELEAITLTADPRITYDTQSDEMALAITNPLTVTRHTSPECDIILHYVLASPLDRTLLQAGHHVWVLSTGSTESIAIKYADQPAELHDVVARNATQTEPIVLIDNYLSVYFDIPSGTLTGDYRYDFDLLVSVDYSFGEIQVQLQNVLAKPDVAAALFEGKASYLSALLDTWRYSPETTLRIGAVALALAYQLNELRGTLDG